MTHDLIRERTIVFSILIPTYNRYDLTCLAIKSAIEFSAGDARYEIIVIDDHSMDGSYEKLIDYIDGFARSYSIKIIRTKENFGVVAARNVGAVVACGVWILLLDSDNELIHDSKSAFERYMAGTNYESIGFRCVDDDGKLIGPDDLASEIDLHYALNVGFCETFGVYRRLSFLEYFASKDVEELRRFESLGYYRLLKTSKVFGISGIVMRKYSFSGADRLSSRAGLRKDAAIMKRGHYLVLTEFYRFMTLNRFLRGLLAVIYYSCLQILNNFKRS